MNAFSISFNEKYLTLSWTRDSPSFKIHLPVWIRDLCPSIYEVVILCKLQPILLINFPMANMDFPIFHRIVSNVPWLDTHFNRDVNHPCESRTYNGENRLPFEQENRNQHQLNDSNGEAKSVWMTSGLLWLWWKTDKVNIWEQWKYKLKFELA